MHLRNNFPDSVRLLFIDDWECFMCGQNGTQSGGLELHHIIGRGSCSALNAAILCNKCHRKIGHSFEEERDLLSKTIKFLLVRDYKLTKEDKEFYESERTKYESAERERHTKFYIGLPPL